jgi:hypothetical protein
LIDQWVWLGCSSVAAHSWSGWPLMGPGCYYYKSIGVQ